MGIAGAWDLIGEGEKVALAKLATDFIRDKGRPMRIAIDEAVWRWNNLNKYQIASIQEKSNAPNPLERLIFFRLMNLLRLNIQPYFVYDGPSRPWKRASRGGLGFHDEELRICKRMLSKLRVPYYQAPGEAEAECVLLEREGIVDAIWTDDSDSFMFGAQKVIRSHKEKKDGKGKAIKSTTHVAVYRARTIKEKSFLDHQGFVLMAMISGGDYNARGLNRCGPNTALKLVKKGLGKSLCEARNDAELAEWRHTLQQTLKGAADVPLGFPCPKTLKKYMEPNVSKPEQVEERKERFHKTYAKDVDENDLRLFLKKDIDIKTRDFLSHIVPWLLIRKLGMMERGNEAANNIPSIQLKPLRTKKASHDVMVNAPLERKIRFLPKDVTKVELGIEPEDEDWRKFLTKKHGAFDPKRRIECDILTCILEKRFPHLLDAEAQDEGKKASDAEAKAQKAAERAAKAHETPSIANATTSALTVESAKEKSVKRKRDHDVDMQMEDAGPRPSKQQRLKDISQEARNKVSSTTKAYRSSPPIQRTGDRRIPAEFDFVDLDGFDTSLLDDSAVLSTTQTSTLRSSTGTVNMSTSKTVTPRKSAVVVDLSDSDEEESPVPNGPVMPSRRTVSSAPERGLHRSGGLASTRDELQPSSAFRGLSKHAINSPTSSSSSAVFAQSKVLHSDGSLSNPHTKPTALSQPPEPEAEDVDEPSPEELRRRRLARFAPPVSKSPQEEVTTSIQDLALTPKSAAPIGTENTWSFANLPTRDEMAPSAPKNKTLLTPKRIAGFVPTSSPLFVTPPPPRTVSVKLPSMFIDLTDD